MAADLAGVRLAPVVVGGPVAWVLAAEAVEQKQALPEAAEALPGAEAVAEAEAEVAEGRQTIDESTNEDKTEHDNVVENFGDRFRDFHFWIFGSCFVCSPGCQIGLDCSFAGNAKRIRHTTTGCR